MSLAAHLLDLRGTQEPQRGGVLGDLDAVVDHQHRHARSRGRGGERVHVGRAAGVEGAGTPHVDGPDPAGMLVRRGRVDLGVELPRVADQQQRELRMLGEDAPDQPQLVLPGTDAEQIAPSGTPVGRAGAGRTGSRAAR